MQKYKKNYLLNKIKKYYFIKIAYGIYNRFTDS